MASGTIKAVASKADVNALSEQIGLYGTLEGNVLTVVQGLGNGYHYFKNSNNPTNKPSDNAKWGSYFVVKSGGLATIYYSDNAYNASAYNVSSSSSSITWASPYDQIALIKQINFGDVTKSLTQNLTSYWTTSVPNDTFPRLCIVTSQGGSWFGYINRYSGNYGAGIFARYDGYSGAVFLNNGTVTIKTLSYQT